MASRFQLANSIREASVGDSIMADIEASIKSSGSASTGKGAATAARYLADTDDKVSTMKRRALGARTDAGINPEEDTFVLDKLSGLARDWMTSQLGDDDSTKDDNKKKLSDLISEEAAKPLDENTSPKERFLRTGEVPRGTELNVPYVESGIRDDAPITYSGDQEAGASGRTAAIDAALKKAVGEEEEDGPLSPDDMPITRANTDFPSRIGMDLNDNTEGEGLMTRPKARPDTIQPETKDFEIPEYKVFDKPSDMSELEILARTIEAEASGEKYAGKIAVGAVIANRVSSGSYGSSGGIRGVILKEAQFSPWNSITGGAKGEQGKDMLALKASDDSYRAANSILTGNYTDETGGASHYVNESISTPKWLNDMKSQEKGTITIGKHLFGNADNNKVYDGKTGSIQSIIGTKTDGQFGPASRKKAISFLKAKGLEVTEETSDADLMQLVVTGKLDQAA